MSKTAHRSKWAGAFMVFAALVLTVGVVAGCNTSSKNESKGGAHGAKAEGEHGAAKEKHGASDDAALKPHQTLDAEVMQRIEDDGLGALKILETSRGDESSLKKAFMGEALQTMQKGYSDDLAAGKIKIRRYGKPKFEVVNYINGLAGVSVQFIDQGYYIDASTEEMLAPPSNKPFRFIFAMKPDGGSWKISAIYETDATRGDPKAKSDSTINKGTQNLGKAAPKH